MKQALLVTLLCVLQTVCAHLYRDRWMNGNGIDPDYMHHRAMSAWSRNAVIEEKNNVVGQKDLPEEQKREIWKGSCFRASSSSIISCTRGGGDTSTSQMRGLSTSQKIVTEEILSLENIHLDEKKILHRK